MFVLSSYIPFFLIFYLHTFQFRSLNIHQNKLFSCHMLSVLNTVYILLGHESRNEFGFFFERSQSININSTLIRAILSLHRVFPRSLYVHIPWWWRYSSINDSNKIYCFYLFLIVTLSTSRHLKKIRFSLIWESQSVSGKRCQLNSILFILCYQQMKKKRNNKSNKTNK